MKLTATILLGWLATSAVAAPPHQPYPPQDKRDTAAPIYPAPRAHSSVLIRRNDTGNPGVHKDSPLESLFKGVGDVVGDILGGIFGSGADDSDESKNKLKKRGSNVDAETLSQIFHAMGDAFDDLLETAKRDMDEDSLHTEFMSKLEGRGIHLEISSLSSLLKELGDVLKNLLQGKGKRGIEKTRGNEPSIQLDPSAFSKLLNKLGSAVSEKDITKTTKRGEPVLNVNLGALSKIFQKLADILSKRETTGSKGEEQTSTLVNRGTSIDINVTDLVSMLGDVLHGLGGLLGGKGSTGKRSYEDAYSLQTRDRHITVDLTGLIEMLGKLLKGLGDVLDKRDIADLPIEEMVNSRVNGDLEVEVGSMDEFLEVITDAVSKRQIGGILSNDKNADRKHSGRDVQAGADSVDNALHDKADTLSKKQIGGILSNKNINNRLAESTNGDAASAVQKRSDDDLDDLFNSFSKGISRVRTNAANTLAIPLVFFAKDSAAPGVPGVLTIPPTVDRHKPAIMGGANYAGGGTVVLKIGGAGFVNSGHKWFDISGGGGTGDLSSRDGGVEIPYYHL